MSLELIVSEYISCIDSFSNQPLNLDVALSPFGIRGNSKRGGNLLVGEFIDYITDQLELSDVINPTVVIEIISDLETTTWIDNLVGELNFEEEEDSQWFEDKYMYHY